MSPSNLAMHEGEGLRVLVGGLGLGYTAQAALASQRVAQVEVVEFLPQVLEWYEADLVPLASELRADDRFAPVEGDIYAWLTAAPGAPSPEPMDLILIDVDHAPDDPLGDSSHRFYTEAGLADARRHLAPGGLLGVWSYAENSPFSRALERTFDEVRVEPVTFYNDLVEEESTDWLFFAR